MQDEIVRYLFLVSPRSAGPKEIASETGLSRATVQIQLRQLIRKEGTLPGFKIHRVNGKYTVEGDNQERSVPIPKKKRDHSP